MLVPVSPSLKWAYVVVVLAAVVPFGLAHSGWVGLMTGMGPLGGVPIVGPLVLLVVGVYRVAMVLRRPAALDSYAAEGAAAWLRTIGAGALYFGAAVAVLNLVAGPLMRGMMGVHTESGIEYVLAGAGLSLLGGIGVLGLLLFELSRLLAFEQRAVVAAPEDVDSSWADTQPSVPFQGVVRR